MRIARFTTGEDPKYGIVDGEEGAEVIHVITGDPIYVPLKPTGEQVKLEDARLLAPVIPRSKVIGVGRNYAEHAAELGNEVPDQPLLFFKPNTAVIGPIDPIVLPQWSDEVHIEGELAVVIGRFCKDVPKDRVDEVVFGYTCANDVTARDMQRQELQWARAKGFDSSCPIGPWIETELDTSGLQLTTKIDGKTVQDASTSLMLHSVADLVFEISRSFTLLPGDVILTGTPAGVSPIENGQRVEVGISGLGTLANPVVRRP